MAEDLREPGRIGDRDRHVDRSGGGEADEARDVHPGQQLGGASGGAATVIPGSRLTGAGASGCAHSISSRS